MKKTVKDEGMLEKQELMMNKVYPLLIQISLILASGLYVSTLVQEREVGMRYLINFQGIGNSAYVCGISFADILISFIPCALLVIFGVGLGLKQFI